MSLNFLSKLYSMDKNLIFSGQLFFREQGTSMSLDMTDRSLFAVVGSIAVPRTVTLRGETQYTIAGFNSEKQGIILGLDQAGYEMKERARGKSIGSLLLEPIWKI